MSAETLQWLNQNTLIGLTEKRGHAWHFDPSLQVEDQLSNHYPSFIPVEDVVSRLFNFEAEEAPAAYLRLARVWGADKPAEVISTVNYNGVNYDVWVDAEHKALVPGDEDGLVWAYQHADWAKHSYRTWLLDNVAQILDTNSGDLGISSAGLLRRRAQAWVEFTIPENIETAEGVTFRPNLACGTSYDSSLATFYKRTIGLIVCDNTLAARLREDGAELRIKHTSSSGLRIGEAREVLQILFKAADDFSNQIRELCATTVTEKQWQGVLDALFPLKDENGDTKKGRSLTIAQNRREKVDTLYHFDSRCAPWVNTAFGVIQSTNTWRLHEATIRNTTGGGRFERNQINVLNGNLTNWDNHVFSVLEEVLAA